MRAFLSIRKGVVMASEVETAGSCNSVQLMVGEAITKMLP